MRQVALVTASAALGTDEDLEPLLDALVRRGITVDAPCWDDDTVVWEEYELAVLRSPWDYVPRYAEFLGWLDRVDRMVRVLNPPDVVRWSTDKRYVGELGDRGIPVVPTRYVTPDAAVDVDALLSGLVSSEIVVKPTVSAGSKDTMRHSTVDSARRHIDELLARGRPVMVQPYLSAIDTYGETGLVYFDGELSHAFRKAPLLALDAPPTAAFFAAEEISAREPSPAERAVADATIGACGGSDLLYGRVDLVPGPDGEPLVLEVELAEPSYFVKHAPGAADRFAQAVEGRLN
jgi:glutathione synthase/RimK-type ligase-like ATP-grasp enzyme